MNERISTEQTLSVLSGITENKALAAARDPKTPSHILEELSKYDNVTVRFLVAFHPSTPRDVRNHLLLTEKFYCDTGLAAYIAKTEEELLYFLAWKRIYGIRTALAENTRTPPWMLHALYVIDVKPNDKDAEEFKLIKALVKNNKTPTETLDMIYNDFYASRQYEIPGEYCYLARFLGDHPNASSVILENLANLAWNELTDPSDDPSDAECWAIVLEHIKLTLNPNTTAELRQSVAQKLESL